MCNFLFIVWKSHVFFHANQLLILTSLLASKLIYHTQIKRIEPTHFWRIWNVFHDFQCIITFLIAINVNTLETWTFEQPFNIFAICLSSVACTNFIFKEYVDNYNTVRILEKWDYIGNFILLVRSQSVQHLSKTWLGSQTTFSWSGFASVGYEWRGYVIQWTFV